MITRTLVTGGSGFIGTNVVAALLASGREVLDLSRSAPRSPLQQAYFRSVDLRDRAAVWRSVEDFQPHEVVHLAARTDFSAQQDREGYDNNTVGTRNLMSALAAVRQPVRLIYASSNVVEGAGIGRRQLEPLETYSYAQSKLVSEQIVRAGALAHVTPCIVRPCYVWGPYFGAPFRQFFLAIARRRYAHLGLHDPPKRIAYVGNLAQQLLGLLGAAEEAVRGQCFYLADYELTTLREWASLIARAFGVAAPPTVPEWLVRAGARAGDLLSLCTRRSMPLTSRRLDNMRADTSGIPIAPIQRLVAQLPYTLEQGVRETVRWLDGRGTGEA